MTPEELEALREEECPEKPWAWHKKKKSPCVGAQEDEDEEFDQEQI